jgi:hypothetical protein
MSESAAIPIAIALARFQDAFALEVRTATSFTRWLADARRCEKGKAILSTVYCPRALTRRT